MTTETILTHDQIVKLIEQHVYDFDHVRNVEQAVLQSPEAQALREQAGLYQWIKKNIKEGYEFDGGYYISDTDTSNWDRTVRAAMEQQK